MSTIRTDRMMDSLPSYYSFSEIMQAIQAAQADEYDAQEALDDGLQKQFYISTATWGLKYWEYSLRIPTNEADSYPIRRSRVLSKWRGFGNFSTALIKSVCEAFTNGEVDVTVNVPAQSVTVKFIGVRGIPENLNDLKAQVENIIHAHLGTVYTFTWLVWNELDTANVTWDQLDAMGFIWDDFERWQPNE